MADCGLRAAADAGRRLPKILNSAASGTNVTAFRQGLAETGFVEGRNLAIEYRWAQGRLDRLPELASDLIRRRVALIATPGDTPAARAAKAATATIPIVFSVASDPVALGLVASLNRPGGNATGFAELNTDLASKRLDILHELVPGAVRFAILVDSNTSPAPTMVASLQAAAATKGWQLESLSVAPTAEDIEVVFTTLAQKRIDAVLVSPGAPFFLLRSQLAELAARHAIPTIYWDRQLVETGGLVSYGSNITDQFRQVGIYAGRILKGAKPADLPVQQPTKFELVINLKTAKALGLEVPPMLLARADEVIE